MKNLKSKAPLFFALVITLVAPSIQATANEWSNVSRALISPETCERVYPFGRWVTRPLGSGEESIKLFYFTTKTFDPKLKSVLYAAGGPGKAVGPDGVMGKLSEPYNMIYFHIRGSGCSQLPAENQYDQYLRTRFVIEDMDAIRKDLGLSKWDLVVGSSYGTLAASEYAEKFPDRVTALFQEHTLVSYDFRNPHVSPYRNAPAIISEILNRNGRGYFSGLSSDEKANIANRISGFLKEFDWIGDYQDAMTQQKYLDPELRRKVPDLTRSKAFLASVYMAFYVGWSPVSPAIDQYQQNTGLSIAGEFYPQKLDATKLAAAQDAMTKQFDGSFKAASSEYSEAAAIDGQSDRVYSVMATYEGLTREMGLAFERGESHPQTNPLVGFATDYQRPFIPSEHAISVPTFMFQGSMDGSTPVEGGLEYFNQSLVGQKAIVILTGAGHVNVNRPCKIELITRVLSNQWTDIPALFGAGAVCEIASGIEFRSNLK